MEQISVIAMGVVVAATALGFAMAGHLPAFNSREVALVRVADSTGAGAARRIYYYGGTSDQQGSLYRGWVCEPEHAPILAN